MTTKYREQAEKFVSLVKTRDVEIDALKSQLAEVTSQFEYRGHLLNEKDKAIDILHSRVATSQARCGKLQACLEEIKFQLEQNVGLDSQSVDENEKLEHRLLAFSAASTVLFRDIALEEIKEALAGDQDKGECKHPQDAMVAAKKSIFTVKEVAVEFVRKRPSARKTKGKRK
jgi:hypothetical protein